MKQDSPNQSLIAFTFEGLSYSKNYAWSRSGLGTSTVHIDGTRPGSLELFDCGTWCEMGGKPMHQFSTRFLFTRLDTTSIEVSKQGPQGWIRLTKLIYRPACGSWESEQPHYCGRDVYEAEVALDPTTQLRISWKVRGPKKDYRTSTRYAANPTLLDWFFKPQ
ncbi:MAG: DUF6314 family protein [Puniceicoccaceae bacterium]